MLHEGIIAWPDEKSKAPARKKVKDGQVGLRIQPKKPRKVKWKEKLERERTGWEEECNVGQRVWLRTKAMHRGKKKTKLKRCGSSSVAWVGPNSF